LSVVSDYTTLVESWPSRAEEETVREVAVGVQPTVTIRERIRRSREKPCTAESLHPRREYEPAFPQLGEPRPWTAAFEGASEDRPCVAIASRVTPARSPRKCRAVLIQVGPGCCAGAHTAADQSVVVVEALEAPTSPLASHEPAGLLRRRC
jgi:hypothetical protein